MEKEVTSVQGELITIKKAQEGDIKALKRYNRREADRAAQYYADRVAHNN